MKKNIFGRKFSRDTNERKALFKSLISSLVLNDRIKTTESKAKAIKADADKIITIVKKNGTEAEKFGRVRLLDKRGLSPEVQNRLINDVAPRFKNRNGGYTRIIRIGRRFGDNAMEVLIEWTEQQKALATSDARGPVAPFPPASARSRNTDMRAVRSPSTRTTPRKGSKSKISKKKEK